MLGPEACHGLKKGGTLDTTDFEAMERNGWADPSIARTYADAFSNATRRVARELADSVGVKAGSTVLDLCSGHGVVAAELVARGAEVTGLDFSPAMVSLAEAAVPEAMFVQGNAMAMAFADGSFDAVTIGFGVPHFPDPARGLAEAARVLTAGGRLAFSIWYGSGSDTCFGWLYEAFARHGDASVSIPEGPDAHQLVDRALANSMLSAAGFEDIAVRDVPSEIWVKEPEHLFDAFLKGAVRAAERFAGQTAAVREAVRADLAERTRSNGREGDDGWYVPATSVVVSARRRSGF